MRGHRAHYYLFLLPILLLSGGVVLIPAFSTGLRAFQQWDGVTEPIFVGWDNFRSLLGDGYFLQALWHNICWLLIFLSIPMLLALAVALGLSRLGPQAKWYQLIFLLPYAISPIVNTKVWSLVLYNDFDGLLAFVNRHLGWSLVNPLSDFSWALPGVALIDLWHFWGFLMVVLFAAARQTPQAQLEAARLEGCSGMQEMRYVRLPHLWPTIRVLMVMVTIWSFLTFDYIYLTTGGGPAGATEVLATMAYSNAFAEFAVGRAAAISVMIGVLGLLTGGLYVLFSRSET